MNYQKGTNDWRLFLLILVVLILCWGGGWFLIDYFVKSDDLDKLTDQAARGVFGDKFGVITSLFSSLAFVGIVFAIMLQRRDLAIQNESIERQFNILALQSFETGFFNLLDQHRANISQLKMSSGDEGRSAFSYFMQLMALEGDVFPVFNVLRKLDRKLIIPLRSATEVPDEVKSVLQESDIKSLNDFIVSRVGSIDRFLDNDLESHHGYIEKAYHSANERTGHALAHYFRTVYVIYKYIDSAVSINELQKKEYARIVRALLSDDELLAIFYNSLIRPQSTVDLHEYGYFKMTFFVKKYDVLQNLSKAKSIHPIHWKLLDKLEGEAEEKFNSLKLGSKCNEN